jgi:putative transposase
LAQFLKLAQPDEIDVIHRHERTGRPLGEEAFIEKLEIELDRVLKTAKTWTKKVHGVNISRTSRTF